MRSAHLVGFAGAIAISTACGGFEGYENPTPTPAATTTGTGSGGTGSGGTGSGGTGSGGTGSGGTGSGGTASGGTTGTATGGTGTGTGGGAGARWGAPTTAGAISNCTTNQGLSSANVTTLAATLGDTIMAWGGSSGGPMHADVSSWAASVVTAAPDNYWGAQIYGTYLPTNPMEGLGYGYAVDSSMAMINPANPTPLAASVTNGGLADGYYEIVTPYLLTIPSAWHANLLPSATTMTIDMYVGVRSGALTTYSIDGNVLNSVMGFNYGSTGWNGDTAASTYLCSVWLVLDGLPVTAN